MASSSPHSSDGATHHETPSTNFTSFSPETIGTTNSSTSTQPKFKLSVTTDRPVSTKKVVATKSGDDVFLNEPASANANSQLSPVAEAFTPSQYLTSSGNVALAGSANSHMAGGDNLAGPGLVGSATPVSNLLPGSVPDDISIAIAQFSAARRPSHTRLARPLPPLHPTTARVQEPYGLIARLGNLTMAASTTSTLLHNITLSEGTFSTDEQRGRAVLISGVPTNFPEYTIRTIFGQQFFASVIGITLKDLKQHGVVLVGFSDIREAADVEPYISDIQPNWTVRRISPKQYAQQVLNVPSYMVTDYEAQLVVTVFYDGNENTFLAIPVLNTLKQTLATFGYIKAFHTLPASQQHAREFRVEFEDVRSALSALISLDLAMIDDFVLKVTRYQPDIASPAQVPNVPAGPAPEANPLTPPVRGGTTARQVLSVTGRSLIPMTTHYPITSHSNSNATHHLYSSPPRHGGRDRYDVNGNHNQVIIPKIEVGLDVRTTIMLRNIPNKIDSAMLKEILDETSHGAYDFMYLRIDFANNCNVGYAFINFIDALAIIPFAMARAGQRWNKYSSDKVAEISYATIQGKDCLVQKFRNSSVMLEDPSFRPKLFTTGSGPGAGEEEPFPGPDNVSKMRRSVENAEHVGLFVPTLMDSPPARPRIQRRTLPPTPPYPHQPHQARTGTYMPPARVLLPSVPGHWRDIGPAPPWVPNHSFITPAPARQPHRQPARPVLTPSTSTESLSTQAYAIPARSTPARSGTVDTSRADDPFVGSRTIRRPTVPNAQPQRLFAPRQGQAYREEQRRRRSQFDRGTPGAEHEAYKYRLADPALSPVHSSYIPRSAGYGNNLSAFGSAYGSGMPIPRPDCGYY